MSLVITSESTEAPPMSAPALPSYQVTLSDEAMLQRKDCIELSQSITSVTTPQEREDAIAACSLIKGLEKRVDEAHSALKRPILDAGNALDKAKRAFLDGLKIERSRVEALTNTYTLEEQKRIEAMRSQEMAEIKLANVNADMDTLRANAEREIELNQKLKVDGARTTEFWEYDVLPGGLMALAQERPDLVSIEPRRREILAAISNGALLPGLRVFRQVKVMAKAS